MMIEDAMEGLRSVLDTATKKTADVFGNSRSYVERAKLRARLNDAYRQLGMAEYEASVNGVASMEQINGLMGRITDLRSAMSELNRSMQPAPATYCPQCGRENPNGEAFCPSCGTKLAK